MLFYLLLSYSLFNLYLIQLHGGDVIHNEEEVDWQTVLVECDRYGVGKYLKDGVRFYTHFAIFQHFETGRVMTRESLDNIPEIDGG